MMVDPYTQWDLKIKKVPQHFPALLANGLAVTQQVQLNASLTVKDICSRLSNIIMLAVYFRECFALSLLLIYVRQYLFWCTSMSVSKIVYLVT